MASHYVTDNTKAHGIESSNFLSQALPTDSPRKSTTTDKDIHD